jgi:hypothetical protein
LSTDASGNPLYSVSGSEADEAANKIVGSIDPNATATIYKSFVRGKDDDGNKFFADDPTIIVGRPSPRAVLIEAQGKLEQVKD